MSRSIKTVIIEFYKIVLLLKDPKNSEMLVEASGEYPKE